MTVSCGTISGYVTHRNRKEEPCEPCLRARREYERGRRYRVLLAEIERDLAKHGSAADYIAHQKAGEPPCDDCQQAWKGYRFKDEYNPETWERIPVMTYG